MKYLYVILLLLFTVPWRSFAGPVEDWQKLEMDVRDGKISREEASLKLETLIGGLSSYYISIVDTKDNTLLSKEEGSSGSGWAFPLKGYGVSAMSKDAFRPGIRYGPYNTKGYDFFDGNQHGGHPAHDIFIRDNNQDCLDDRTRKPVAVAVMVDCLVLETYTGWYPASKLRGGNVVWLYNPNLQMIFYYAHLDKVMVKSGQFLKAGEFIGTIGRTGFSAYKKTSPTHLHLMVLQCQENKFKPYNYYSNLSKNPQ